MFNMYTPEQIRAIRLALGLTVAQFAEKLGVDRNAVYLWEAGKRHPVYRRMVEINELAEGLELSA